MIAQTATIQSEFIFEQAPFSSCHASTIVETRRGNLLAAWFGGSKEGARDVSIYLSRRDNSGWSTPIAVASGFDKKGQQVACWNPVLFRSKSGHILLFYKVGPSPQRWLGWERISTDEGLTWGPPIELPKGILGPIKNKPVQLASGRILSGSSEERGGWTVHFEFSDDDGATWKRTTTVNSAGQIGAIQPAILEEANGRVVAVGRTNMGSLFYIQSLDNGTTWGQMRLLGVNNPNSGIDAVNLNSGLFALVYNDSKIKRSPLDLALSRDGIHWYRETVLEDVPGEFSYPAIIQTSDGMIHITYTYDRKRIKHVVIDPSQWVQSDVQSLGKG